jgi:periplasmic protein TonB
MTNALMYEQLDNAIDAMFRTPSKETEQENRELAGLLGLARELSCIPRLDFKERLLLDLEAKANADRRSLPIFRKSGVADMPTLFGGGIPLTPVSRMNVAASLLMHATAVVLIVTAGYITVEKKALTAQSITLVDPSHRALPRAPDFSGGGGGGGDHSKTNASQGALPKLEREQITPPAAVIRNEQAKLEVPPSIIVPINIQSPQLPTLGDPASNVTVASNGVGSGSGIGSGTGGGIGVGAGRGIGPGYGAGAGGGIYRVGGGVSAPRTLYAPDPDYSEEARKAKYQGTVVLWTIVGPDGKPREIRVVRSLGMGLDEKAVEALRKWRFAPAYKEGQPVAVQINVEVNFQLY